MKLIKQPDDNCLVYAFAMVTEIDPESIFQYIGHRGQETWWRPNGKRGIHFQEILDFALDNDLVITLVDREPVSVNELFPDDPRIVTSGLYIHALLMYDGILVGPNQRGKQHAYAWDSENQWIYDPNGAIYTGDVDKIYKSCHLFLPVLQIKSKK